MQWLKKYLEERKGVNSLIRLQSLLTLIFSFIIITWQMVEGKIHIELNVLLITASFAPKALQKFAEKGIYKSEKAEEMNKEQPQIIGELNNEH